MSWFTFALTFSIYGYSEKRKEVTMNVSQTNQTKQDLLPSGQKEAIPFILHFGKKNDSAAVRQPGMESEFWSEAYKTTDSD